MKASTEVSPCLPHMRLPGESRCRASSAEASSSGLRWIRAGEADTRGMQACSWLPSSGLEASSSGLRERQIPQGCRLAYGYQAAGSQAPLMQGSLPAELPRRPCWRTGARRHDARRPTCTASLGSWTRRWNRSQCCVHTHPRHPWNPLRHQTPLQHSQMQPDTGAERHRPAEELRSLHLCP